MSDLEDTDPGAEELHLEEELSAHPEHHLQPPEHQGDELEEHYEPPKSGGGTVLKIVIVAVILAAGGGGYFVLKSRNSAVASRREITAQAQPVPPLSKAANNFDKKPGDNAMAASSNSTPAPTLPANGMPASIGMPAAITAPPAEIAAAPANPVAAAPNAVPVPPAAAAVVPPVAPSMPEAIPSMPSAASVTPPSGSSGGSSSAALSPAPPIVNDQPPSSALLTTTQGAAAKSNIPAPVSPAPPSPSLATEMTPSAIPGAVPGSPSSGTKTASVFAQKAAATANAGPGVDTLPSPLTPSPQSQIKNGEAMPSDVVPSSDKTDIRKTETGSPEMPKTKTFMPTTDTAQEATPSPKMEDKAEDSAKVEELQKKIDELEKTISQLQQSPVIKEDAEKTASETGTEGTAVPKASHKKLAHRRRPSAKTHVAATTWVLKAAKPGVAWIARKGTDDLKMVEVGDSLAGIGRVTAIVKTSSGNWTVNGTKGRISQ